MANRIPVREPDGGTPGPTQLGTTPVQIALTVDVVGRVRSLVFDRWGDPDRTGVWG